MQSYLHGVSDIPLMGLTIGNLLEETAKKYPETEALIVSHQNLRWSYHELNRQVDMMAAGLIALGLEPGDRIGVWAPNMAEWVVLQFATAKAGLILVSWMPVVVSTSRSGSSRYGFGPKLSVTRA